ncbi:MAG: hypothetical protein A2161_05750 [Candidatus Schekmanbacteria bacterium RBG_13_48_7]|uniref:Undecaprenyl-diphosphatase n=1 Tax=Candidatus Schekmanbacteria bacterium RBG_13_48_7 TaxID=1817878 RepID=A0A1F7RPZ7_9BACT|nr:MAG: hypothetical protein A2161_05750 [Candidatus Schekmanbacteria bacterium RBG_13_48_7]
MESIIKYILLGIIQGLTEFLPVSSSGHLVIFQKIFGLKEPQLFLDVILHLGTTAAVIYFLRKDLKSLIYGIYTNFILRQTDKKNSLKLLSIEPFRLIFLLFIACLPTGLMGIFFKDTFEKLFGSVLTVGIALCITGCILFLTRWFRDGHRGIPEMTITDALLAGLAQGIAITPGISRSGITIAVLIFLGIDRELLAKFSFMLAIPAILGAAVIESRHLSGFPSDLIIPFSLGFAASAFFGFIALFVLLNIVRKGKLNLFAFYCWAVGIIVILHQLFAQ